MESGGPYAIPGRAERLSPLVERVLCANPGPLTFAGTNSYIIGRFEAALIDPGPDDGAHLKALLAALRGRRLVAILVTHAHADHWPLARRLKARAGGTIMGWGDGPFIPDRRLRHGSVIAGKGWRLRALHTPGHRRDHLCFELTQERALFSGDHVMGWSTSVIAPPEGNMGEYLASLRKLEAKGHARHYPAHGAPIEAPLARIKALLAHRLAREAQVARALKEGCCTLEEITARVYPDIPVPLKPAARLSIQAHLERLSRHGRAG